jgi:hypothetical protein
MDEEQKQKAMQQAYSITEFLAGDKEAAAFCDAFFFITQVWDDLADKDKEIDPEDINRAFWLALVEIPRNRFYLRHAAEIGPFLAASINAWFDANELERGSTHERSLAFVLRDLVGGLISRCAYLIGGYEWMRKVSPDIRRLVHDEPLGLYLRGLK